MGNLKSKSKIYIEVQRAKNSQDTSEKKKKKQDIKLLLHYYKIVVIKTMWLAWD